MSRSSVGLFAVSVLFLAVFFGGAVGLRLPGGGGDLPRNGGDLPTYHAPTAGAVPNPGVCGSGDCHMAYPHRSGGTVSAFLNYHGEFTDCTVCHGPEAVSWEARKREEGGPWHLVSRGPLPPGDPHEKLSVPRGCRQCHSPRGMEDLGSRGVQEFPQGFDSPIALRMIEESRKRWLPAGLQ